MNTITIEIKCYGAFRELGDSFVVEVPQNANIAELKQKLSNTLKASYQSLIAESVFADTQQILPNHYQLQTTTTLSILPPVCGG